MKKILLSISVYGGDFAYLHQTKAGNILVACNIDWLSKDLQRFFDVCHEEIVSWSQGDRALVELTPKGYTRLCRHFSVKVNTKKLALEKVQHNNRLIWQFTDN